jgi:hypothetical protein
MYKEDINKMSRRYILISTGASLTLGGADKRMEAIKTFSYQPELLKADTYDNLKDWLETYHPKDAKRLIASAYCKKNFSKAEVLDAFQEELDELDVYREEQVKLNEKEKETNILEKANRYIYYIELKKKGNKPKPNVGGPKGFQKRDKKTIKEKLEETISSGKALDITNANFDGKRITASIMREGNGKTRLSNDKGSNFYYVVFNKNKSPFDGIANFLTLYGGISEEEIKDYIRSIRENVDIVDLKSGKKKNKPSKGGWSSPVKKRAVIEDDMDDFI